MLIYFSSLFSPLHPDFKHFMYIFIYLSVTMYLIVIVPGVHSEISVFLLQPENDLLCFAASWALGSTDEENHEDDCWRRLINHRFPHHVWRLPV